jgi:sortase A
MSRRAWSWVERTLLAIGVACLGVYGFATLDARRYQDEQRTVFQTRAGAKPDLPAAATNDTPAAAETAAPSATEAVETGTLLGMLDVPRLKLSTPVVEGDDDDTLSKAVGHLPDTPLPWQPGNSAVAAHRDTIFRPLKDIAVGDEIRFRVPTGEIRYRVTRTSIVNPEDVSVLDPGSRDMLTLITCYPFYYVGHAPQRFIVHAERE